MNKYNTLVKSLITFDIDVLDDCHTMLSISIKGDESYTPDLYQIWKKINILILIARKIHIIYFKNMK